jgi:GTPase SAR1 family protein
MIEEKKPEESEFRSVKVLFLGRAGVGKTSLGLRYTKNSFCEKYTPTIGVEVYFK